MGSEAVLNPVALSIKSLLPKRFPELEGKIPSIHMLYLKHYQTVGIKDRNVRDPNI